MSEKFSLREVDYLPKELEEGVLFYSEEYSIAAHLCACGCGNTVYTPVKAGEWSIRKEAAGPSLKPSIGNWNLPCRSHYWLQNGCVEWSYAWSDERIEAGRRAEEETRLALHRRRSEWRRIFVRAREWLAHWLSR